MVEAVDDTRTAWEDASLKHHREYAELRAFSLLARRADDSAQRSDES